ncbi:MAG: class I SAM-dependent methyltransferase [Catenulispora sp.]
MDPDTQDLQDLQHPRFARAYLKLSAASEARGVASHRVKLLSGLAGRVVEVGAGNGLNFGHYPPAVTDVVAVEPDDILRAVAERAAAEAPVPVRVAAGHAEALPGADGSFDAAVASLVLCSVPSQDRALAEIARVLRAGGLLAFYEHVRSARPVVGWAEDLVTPIWRRAAGGCHPNRDTVRAVERAGFVVDAVDRFPFRHSPYLPGLAHVIGRAHKL